MKKKSKIVSRKHHNRHTSEMIQILKLKEMKMKVENTKFVDIS
jgi:hypothetical protein